jgi:hypothetical protein
MAILDGDVDKALKHTNAFYPSVLKDNEHIYFRLRSRKFIEMIRRAAEIRSVTINVSKKSNGHAGEWYDDVINHDMELDEPSVTHNGWDRMDTEGTHDSQADYTRLLDETIQYGQELQAEFQHDPRREVQTSLREAFALLAYEDPINSKEVSHLLKREGRVSVAEELNAAILGTATFLFLVISYIERTQILSTVRRIISDMKQFHLANPHAPLWNASYNKPQYSSMTSVITAGQVPLLISTTI